MRRHHIYKITILCKKANTWRKSSVWYGKKEEEKKKKRGETLPWQDLFLNDGCSNLLGKLDGRSISCARGWMVTQQVKAVKNTSKIRRIKKKKKSEGRTINSSSSAALCTGWTMQRCSAKQRGTLSPLWAHTGGSSSRSHQRQGELCHRCWQDPQHPCAVRNHSGPYVCPKRNVWGDPITAGFQLWC